ncbi:MAG: pyridoxal-phosphate-dependent aminotransferase family protein [Longimicrobiaceae bacterium]
MSTEGASGFGSFFLPGPTEVHPEVMAALQLPMTGHRDPALERVIAEIDPRLRSLFRTERPVYVLTGSGTAAMEMGVRGGVLHRALCLVNGAFSDRFRKIVELSGKEAGVYEVPWGQAHDPAEVERRLASGEYDAVTVAHSETSTGVLNPVAGIAAACRRAAEASGREILTLVDGVSSVGGAPVEFDEWGLDFLLTGSQKALALPPGLAFCAASKRLLERARSLPSRGLYLDLLRYHHEWTDHQTPFTPAVSLIFALAAQLRRMEKEGIEERWSRHASMASACHRWVLEKRARFGLETLAPDGFRSPTVTAIQLPGRLRPASGLLRGLEERGFSVGAGYGQLGDQTVRVGHMGDHTVQGVERLLTVMEEVLAVA